MTPEDRLAALEKELKKLKAQVEELKKKTDTTAFVHAKDITVRTYPWNQEL